MITIKKHDVEITCSVEEAKDLFPELFSQKEKVIVTKEVAEKHSEAAKGIKKKKKEEGEERKNKKWSKSEIAYLKNNYDHEKDNKKEIAEALKRTRSAVRNKVQKYGLMKGDKNPYEANRKRMKFINNRAAYLCKQYNYTYEKARIYAITEWNEGERKIEAKRQEAAKKQDKQFPLMRTLAVGHTKNIIPVFHHIISNKGCLTRNETERIANPSFGFWNNVAWGNFLTEVIGKSKDIASYFGVRNLFSIKNKEGKKILCYGE